MKENTSEKVPLTKIPLTLPKTVRLGPGVTSKDFQPTKDCWSVGPRVDRRSNPSPGESWELRSSVPNGRMSEGTISLWSQPGAGYRVIIPSFEARYRLSIEVLYHLNCTDRCTQIWRRKDTFVFTFETIGRLALKWMRSVTSPTTAAIQLTRKTVESSRWPTLRCLMMMSEDSKPSGFCRKKKGKVGHRWKVKWVDMSASISTWFSY